MIIRILSSSHQFIKKKIKLFVEELKCNLSQLKPVKQKQLKLIFKIFFQF